MIPASTLAIAAGGTKARIYGAALRLFAERGGEAVTVSELAEAAGIARGTIYNNISEPENIFGEVASALAHEMIWRTEATMGDLANPAARLATGIRIFVRRAHDDRHWGGFLVRFALAHTALNALMQEPPARDIERAIQDGLFKADSDNVPALVTMLNGATLAAMNAIIRGDQTWRSAGSQTAELFLRAGGVSRTEARKLSRTELAPLSERPLKKSSTSTSRASTGERH